MKTKKSIELVKEAVPLVATLRAVLMEKIAVDPKIEQAYENCTAWLGCAHEKLTREGVAV